MIVLSFTIPPYLLLTYSTLLGTRSSFLSPDRKRASLDRGVSLKLALEMLEGKFSNEYIQIKYNQRLCYINTKLIPACIRNYFKVPQCHGGLNNLILSNFSCSFVLSTLAIIALDQMYFCVKILFLFSQGCETAKIDQGGDL